MIYTVGLMTTYEPALSSGSATKKGRSDTYPGGMVWQNAEEAHMYILVNGSVGVRAVYGVEADWSADTYQQPGETFRRLTRDARVVRLA